MLEIVVTFAKELELRHCTTSNVGLVIMLAKQIELRHYTTSNVDLVITFAKELEHRNNNRNANVIDDNTKNYLIHCYNKNIIIHTFANRL